MFLEWALTVENACQSAGVQIAPRDYTDNIALPRLPRHGGGQHRRFRYRMYEGALFSRTGAAPSTDELKINMRAGQFGIQPEQWCSNRNSANIVARSRNPGAQKSITCPVPAARAFCST